MGPLLPSTKHRRGRRTSRQQAALNDPPHYLLDPSPEGVAEAFAGGGRVVLDVGFGTGEAVVAHALAQPDTRILAIDMHTPGIGDLLASISELRLTNVYVIEADVRPILAECIEINALSGARTYFPDPWPKKRHHRRRLIQHDFVELMAGRIGTGGSWDIATDWPDYAQHIESVLDASRYWRGGRIDRPAERPLTRFERRGLAAGRAAIDLRYVREDH